MKKKGGGGLGKLWGFWKRGVSWENKGFPGFMVKNEGFC